MARTLPSPAAIALMGAGITVADLADALDVTRGTASRYLSGQSPTPRHLRDTIAALVGPQAADAVMRRVVEAREAYEIGQVARRRHLRRLIQAQA